MPKETNKELKTVALNARLKPSVKALLDALAAQENRSIANFIEKLVLDYARRKKHPRAANASAAGADPA